jgi:hypothetical protein
MALPAIAENVRIGCSPLIALEMNACCLLPHHCGILTSRNENRSEFAIL